MFWIHHAWIGGYTQVRVLPCSSDKLFSSQGHSTSTQLSGLELAWSTDSSSDDVMPFQPDYNRTSEYICNLDMFYFITRRVMGTHEFD